MIIAIIEDDPYFAEDLQYFMNESDIDSDIFLTADAFLNSDMSKYNSFILDILMRRPTGSIIEEYEENNEYNTGEWLYKIIRSQRSNVPIVIISGSDIFDINIDFNDKNTLYARKPVSMEMLTNIINYMKYNS